jgi:hypothetical protein
MGALRQKGLERAAPLSTSHGSSRNMKFEFKFFHFMNWKRVVRVYRWFGIIIGCNLGQPILIRETVADEPPIFPSRELRDYSSIRVGLETDAKAGFFLRRI